MTGYRNGFCVPSDTLDVRLKLADPEAFQEAALICQRELDRLAANESLAARVRRLLLEKQQGFPTLAVTARLFHMTPRTLHRRLMEEGTSYRDLLESVRHTLAVEHVKSGRFSLDEIAYRLGYTRSRELPPRVSALGVRPTFGVPTRTPTGHPPDQICQTGPRSHLPTLDSFAVKIGEGVFSACALIFFGIRVHAATLLSSHEHLIVADPYRRLPFFLRGRLLLYLLIRLFIRTT